MGNDLLIVGNGFDKNIDLNTDFDHYLDKRGSEGIRIELLSFLSRARNHNLFIDENWNSFEKVICHYLNFVEYLFVSSDFQKQGIGKALLKHIKNIFWSLMVKVYQKNTSAVSFFEKQFFFVRDKMNNADTGECELCMEWIR